MTLTHLFFSFNHQPYHISSETQMHNRTKYLFHTFLIPFIFSTHHLCSQPTHVVIEHEAEVVKVLAHAPDNVAAVQPF